MRRPLAFFTLPTTLVLVSLGCDEGSATQDASVIEPDAYTPPASPKILTFEATLDAVPRGETVTLHWKVENAQVITIFSATEILVNTTEPEGTVSTLPVRRHASFDIRAAGYGTVGETVDVDAIWPEPVIKEMSLDPESTYINGFTMIHWVTENAEKVSVYANGNLLPGGTFMGAQAVSGTTFLPVTVETTVVQVKAENPTHTRTQERTIIAVPPPQILSFTARPRTFVGSSTTVTVTWETQGFDYTDLLNNYIPIPGFSRALSGSTTVEVFQTTNLQLWGYFSDTVFGQMEAMVGMAQTEFEPNDLPTQASSITYEGGVQGSLSSETDVDYYYIDVYSFIGFSDLRVWTRGLEGCTTDTKIEVIDAATMMVIGTDEDDGVPTGRGGGCAEINPERDVFAQNLYGSFIIGVKSERNEKGDYLLLTETTGVPFGR